MPNYSWPEESKRKIIGKRISRLDGPDKSSGRAKYPSDLNPQGLDLRQPPHLSSCACSREEHRYQRCREDEGRHRCSSHLQTRN